MSPEARSSGDLARAATGQARRSALAATRGAHWLSRHWLLIANLLVALYTGLAFAAPVLMHVGAVGPATVLYKIYSPFCHQMGFRSWYLFGDQPYYPLKVAGIPGVRSFEEYVRDEPIFAGLDSEARFAQYSWIARSFVGNEQMGYKIALCQRDVALYTALLAGGILFGLLRRRLGPLRWQLFVVIGILPVAIDGGYQLLSSLVPWLPRHETTPLLRSITGALFGLGLVWLTYPQIHLGMHEMEVEFRDKLARVKSRREDGVPGSRVRTTQP